MLAALLLISGCGGPRKSVEQLFSYREIPSRQEASLAQPASLSPVPQRAAEGDRGVVLAGHSKAEPEFASTANYLAEAEDTENLPTPPLPNVELLPPVESTLELGQLLQSVRMHFPLIQVALASRGIAAGQVLEALGAFDHKLSGHSINKPLGFYENYRHKIGVKRDTYWGGQVFGNYRLGRGDFEPWYLERETNAGGEFKAGVIAPLSQDRWIDPNRSALWQAQLEQNRVEPEIQTEIILTMRDATGLYWSWVAANENYKIAQGLLRIAEERQDGFEKQFRAGDRKEIDLTDNRRIIVSREAKLIDSRQKLEQAAIKLSLFLRSADGAPWIPEDLMLPDSFPPIFECDQRDVAVDIEIALANRPETAALDLQSEQLNVELNQAKNLTLPALDAKVEGSQDMGAPTSPKRDKSPFVLETGIFLDVPLERRKAWGKIRSLQAKLAQVRAKRQFTAEKIVTDVQAAQVALDATRRRVEKTSQSVELARQMEQAERRQMELGNSNLLNVNIREKQTADAATEFVSAKFSYYLAEADYFAALGTWFGELPPLDPAMSIDSEPCVVPIEPAEQPSE